MPLIILVWYGAPFSIAHSSVHRAMNPPRCVRVCGQQYATWGCDWSGSAELKPIRESNICCWYPSLFNRLSQGRFTILFQNIPKLYHLWNQTIYSSIMLDLLDLCKMLLGGTLSPLKFGDCNFYCLCWPNCHLLMQCSTQRRNENRSNKNVFTMCFKVFAHCQNILGQLSDSCLVFFRPNIYITNWRQHERFGGSSDQSSTNKSFVHLVRCFVRARSIVRKVTTQWWLGWLQRCLRCWTDHVAAPKTSAPEAPDPALPKICSEFWGQISIEHGAR